MDWAEQVLVSAVFASTQISSWRASSDRTLPFWASACITLSTIGQDPVLPLQTWGRDSGSGDVRSVVVALRNSTWTYARREDISVSVEFAVLELRARLLAAFGVALPDGDARKRSPWREMIKTDHPEHFSAATLKLQEQGYESNGIFDLGRYEDSPVATSTLMGIIEQFHRRGTKVVLLAMPQHSTLNQRIPSEALQVLERQLRRTFPGNEPPILDFRKAVEDSGFVDLPHLNRKGSLEFSQKLGKRSARPAAQGTPLMVHRQAQTGP